MVRRLPDTGLLKMVQREKTNDKHTRPRPGRQSEKKKMKPGRRTHRYELLGDNLCIRNDFAIYSDGFGV